MTPEELREDLASRVRALEASMADVQSEQAATRSDVASLRQLVQNLVPVSERTAVLVVEVAGVKDDVSRVEKKFDERWRNLEAAQTDARKDSRSLRNILIGVGVAAVLSPFGGVMVALIVGKA